MVAGFLPKIESQSEKGTQTYQKCKNMVYNTCLNAFFEPLIQSFNEGGFWLRLFGRERCFLPVLAFFAQDSKEGNTMTGCYGTANCAFPCRICWTPRADLANPRAAVPGSLRIQDDIIRVIEEHVSVIEAGVQGTIGAAKAALKAISMNGYRNALWKLPFGDSVQGIFGATPPELLHQYGLGIEKNAVQHTWELVAQACTNRGGQFDLPKQLLDSRFAAFNYRHADPEKPKFRFAVGTYELAFLTSKEYSAIVLQVCMYVVSVLVNFPDVHCMQR